MGKWWDTRYKFSIDRWLKSSWGDKGLRECKIYGGSRGISSASDERVLLEMEVIEMRLSLKEVLERERWNSYQK